MLVSSLRECCQKRYLKFEHNFLETLLLKQFKSKDKENVEAGMEFESLTVKER